MRLRKRSRKENRKQTGKKTEKKQNVASPILDVKFYLVLQLLANQIEKNIYVPSGAIGGIDFIKSANILVGLSDVSITTSYQSS